METYSSMNIKMELKWNLIVWTQLTVSTKVNSAKWLDICGNQLRFLGISSADWSRGPSKRLVVLGCQTTGYFSDCICCCIMLEVPTLHCNRKCFGSETFVLVYLSLKDPLDQILHDLGSKQVIEHGLGNMRLMKAFGKFLTCFDGIGWQYF